MDVQSYANFQRSFATFTSKNVITQRFKNYFNRVSPSKDQQLRQKTQALKVPGSTPLQIHINFFVVTTRCMGEAC